MAQDFFSLPLTLLRGSGLWTTSPTYLKFISICVLFPISLIVNVCVIYDFHFTNIRDQISKTVDLIEAASTLGQLILNKIVLLSYRKLIQEVFQEKNQFWDVDTFGKQFGDYFRGRMIFITKFVKSMLMLNMSVIFSICCSAILEHKKTLLESWTFDNAVLNGALFAMQAVCSIEIIYLDATFQSFYLLICTDIQVQFQLLQKKLQMIRLELQVEEQSLNDLIKCTKLHTTLLSVHKNVNTIFGEYLLVQYFFALLTVSPQFYILIYVSPNIADMIKCVCYLAAMAFQVGLFFIPASNIEAEAENFAEEVYKINWEETNNKQIRKQVFFMIMKAQQPLVVLAGGIVHINKNEYILLFRLAFSISTLMGTIKDREEQ